MIGPLENACPLAVRANPIGKAYIYTSGRCGVPRRFRRTSEQRKCAHSPDQRLYRWRQIPPRAVNDAAVAKPKDRPR